MCSYLEGVLSDGFDDLLEGDFRGECVSMIDYRLSFISVPTIQLHTAAPLIQSPEHKHVLCLKSANVDNNYWKLIEQQYCYF